MRESSSESLSGAAPLAGMSSTADPLELPMGGVVVWALLEFAAGIAEAGRADVAGVAGDGGVATAARAVGALAVDLERK